jgi:hypothetical protein
MLTFRRASLALALAAPPLALACSGGNEAVCTTATGGAGGHTTTTSSSLTHSTTTSSSSTSTSSSSATSSTTTSTSSTTSAPADAGPDAPAVCNTTIARYALDPGIHVSACFPITWSTNPPTSGPHYPIWAAFKTYDAPIPRGFWVHDLEHGAIVIAYNCPSGCDAELAELAAFLDARPVDPQCAPAVKRRVVVVPDPLLDTTFAAAAWGWALESSCFDLAMLAPFYDAHYAQAPENTCADGVDVGAADAGIPADCGQPDGG